MKNRKDNVLLYFLVESKSNRRLALLIALASIALAYYFYTTDGMFYTYIFVILSALSIIYFLLSKMRIVNGGMKDNEFDALVAADTDKVYKRSFVMLNVENYEVCELQPIITISPEIFPGKKENFFKYSDDGAVRFAYAKYVSMFFGESQIYLYSCNLNFVDGTSSYDSTIDIFYNDIKFISTEITAEPYGNVFREVFKLILNLSDNSKIEFILRNTVIKNQHNGVREILESEKNIIGAIKQLVKEKKTR